VPAVLFSPDLPSSVHVLKTLSVPLEYQDEIFLVTFNIHLFNSELSNLRLGS